MSLNAAVKLQRIELNHEALNSLFQQKDFDEDDAITARSILDKELCKTARQNEILDILSEDVEEKWDEFEELTEQRHEIVQDRIKMGRRLAQMFRRQQELQEQIEEQERPTDQIEEVEEESHHHSDSVRYSTIMSRSEIEYEVEELKAECVEQLDSQRENILKYAHKALQKHLQKWLFEHQETSRDILRRLKANHKQDRHEHKNHQKHKLCVVVKIFKR